MGESTEPGQYIAYTKIVLHDGRESSDGLQIEISRGDDGSGPSQILLLDSRVSDLDLIPIRDRISRCLKGEETCKECGWPVEMDNPLTMYIDGVRGGFNCYCTYAKR